MGRAIDRLRKAKSCLCERYRVRKIGVFGSYTRNEQGLESDADIPVELDEPIGWDAVNLKEEPERMPGLPVDLALKGGIVRRPRLMRAVGEEAIYV